MKPHTCAWLDQKTWKPCGAHVEFHQTGSGIPLCEDHASVAFDAGASVIENATGNILIPDTKNPAQAEA